MWTDFDTNLHEFTRITITQIKAKHVKLDMERYIEDLLLEHFSAGIHRTFSMPADTDLSNAVHKAAAEKDDKYANSEISKKFRRMVMQLLYCAHQARPDIAVNVSMLTRVQAWPSPDLLNRAEKIFAYLSGTKELGPIYKAKDYTYSVRPTLNWAPRVDVEGTSDASFDVAHSTSRHIFFSSGVAIAWATKKQRSIALSSYEAEVVAGPEAACQAVAIRGLLEKLNIKQHEPTTLSIDNTAAIDASGDPICTMIGPSTSQGATSSSASSFQTTSSSPSLYTDRGESRGRVGQPTAEGGIHQAPQQAARHFHLTSCSSIPSEHGDGGLQMVAAVPLLTTVVIEVTYLLV